VGSKDSIHGGLLPLFNTAAQVGGEGFSSLICTKNNGTTGMNSLKNNIILRDSPRQLIKQN
jgi:hypothetical protein